MRSKTTKGARPRASAAPKLTGRAAKDAAMKEMRQLAERGGFTGWAHVLAAYEALHADDGSLRIWAGGADISTIDMICERWRRAQPRGR